MSDRYCDDCEDEIPAGQRRHRCPYCGQMVCGWCWNHVHALFGPHQTAPGSDPTPEPAGDSP